MRHMQPPTHTHIHTHTHTHIHTHTQVQRAELMRHMQPPIATATEESSMAGLPREQKGGDPATSLPLAHRAKRVALADTNVSQDTAPAFNSVEGGEGREADILAGGLGVSSDTRRVLSPLRRMVQGVLLTAFRSWHLACARSPAEQGAPRSADRSSVSEQGKENANGEFADFQKRMCDLRVEVVVSMFARLTDWVGFRPLVYDLLYLREQKEVDYRLGVMNMFEEAVAVNYWVLDLSHVEYRRILQDLIFLGA